MKKICSLLAATILFCFTLTGCNAIKAQNTLTADSDSINIADVSLSRETEEVRDRVEPKNPEGYYDLYEYYEGYNYYVITGKAKNNSANEFFADSCLMKSNVGNKSYDAKIVFLNEDESEFKNSIKPNEECTYIILTLVEKGDKPDGFKIYYNNNLKIEKNQTNFDNEIVVETKK